nr:hypothetical protein Iba_chr10dCG8540 [Ipomoea batatas]
MGRRSRGAINSPNAEMRRRRRKSHKLIKGKKEEGLPESSKLTSERGKKGSDREEGRNAEESSRITTEDK